MNTYPIRRAAPCLLALTVFLLFAALPAGTGGALPARVGAQSANLLQNPGFEADFTGWFHGEDPPGAVTAIDASVAHSGSKSLRITFDGSADVDYWPVSQDVPVEGNATYCLQGYLRVSGIRDFSSVMLVVHDQRGNHYFEYRTRDLYTTQDWTQVTFTFTTLADTSAVRLIVLRSAVGGRFPITGTAWVDDVSLVRLPPQISPAALTLRTGAVQEVTASNGKAPFTWRSSNNHVAAVHPLGDTTRARITAKSMGEARITAVDASGKQAVLALTVIDRSAITVYAGRTVREVPEGMFGSNVTYFATGEYMPDHPVWGDVITDPTFIADVAALDISSLRYPGAMEANYYDFSTGKGYVGWIGGTGQYNVSGGIGTEPFIQFLRDTDIPGAMITANVYKSGNKNWPGDNWISPQVAADWVAYTNSLGFRVKYWELGNEVTASDEFPWITDPTPIEVQVPGLTRDLYLHKVHTWSQAMKAVDPTIKIGAVVLETPRGGGVAEWWTLPVIQDKADDIDFLIVHPYVNVGPYMSEAAYSDRTVREAYAWMWATSPIRILRGWIETFAPEHADRIEIQATEWGVTSAHEVEQDYDTLLNAVLNTDSLWDMIQEGTDGAYIWNLCEFPFPTIEAIPGGQKYAQYHMLWMNRNRSGRWLVESQVESPTYSAGPFGGKETMDYVPAVEGVPYLSAYVSLSEDGQRLYLIVTNKSGEAQPTSVRLDGFAPDGPVSTWRMSSARWDDTGVEPVTAVISTAAALSYTFPARSVTSFIFDGRLQETRRVYLPDVKR